MEARRDSSIFVVRGQTILKGEKNRSMTTNFYNNLTRSFFVAGRKKSERVSERAKKFGQYRQSERRKWKALYCFSVSFAFFRLVDEKRKRKRSIISGCQVVVVVVGNAPLVKRVKSFIDHNNSEIVSIPYLKKSIDCTLIYFSAQLENVREREKKE